MRAHAHLTRACRCDDRKFAYFSPERLERGIYEPAAVARQFAPMHLNEQLTLDEQLTLRRQRRLAADDERPAAPDPRRHRPPQNGR